MEQIDFTLLTEEEIFGDEKLDVIDKYGATAKMTDYAYLLGCASKDGNGYYWISIDWDIYKKTVEHSVLYINECGTTDWNNYFFIYNGCRPVFSYFKIKDIINNFKDYNNISENLLKIKYGEYPQQVASIDLQKKLEKKYSKNKLEIIGKYTDPLYYNEKADSEYDHINNVYEYKGRKFVRIKANRSKQGIVINGIKIECGQYVWIEIQSIEWIVDIKNAKVLSKKILFTGIPYVYVKYINYYLKKLDLNFESSDIKIFFDNCFAKEIFQFEKKEPVEKDEITKLLDEINEYLIYANNKEELTKELNDLINKYNENVKSTLSSKGMILQTTDQYKIALTLKLNEILSKLKKIYERKHYYEEIIKILEKYLDILNGKNEEDLPEDELISDFSKIQIANKYLENNNMQNEFENIIKNEIERINQYLNSTSIENLEYQDQESFEIYFRKKIHPLLKELYNRVINRDIQIKLKTIRDANKTIELTKNKITDFYMGEIEKEIIELKKLNPNIKLDKYLNIKDNFNINDLVTDLTSILIELYKIEFDLRKELAEQEKIEETQIKYKF